MYRYWLVLHRFRWWTRSALFLGSVVLALYGVHIKYGPKPIASFDECVKAGYILSDTDPQTCSDGKQTFAQTPVAPAAAVALEKPQIVTMTEVETLVGGDSRGTYPARQQIIRTGARWQQFWSQVHTAIRPLPPLIAVDFKQSWVIAITAGPSEKPGHMVTVTNVETGEKGSTVYVTEYVPTAHCPISKTVSNYYFLGRVKALPEPVKFAVEKKERACPAPKADKP